MVALQSPEERVWRFGEFVADADSRLLLRNAQPVPVGPKAFDLLIALLECRGRIVSKQFLLDRVWPDTIVDVNNLNQQIAALRRALDDSHSGWIETIPRVGFRFRAEAVADGRPVQRRTLFLWAAGVAAVALIALPLIPSREPDARASVRSLAVLPLHGDGASPDDAYLGLAIADALTRRFTESNSLSVRPISAISRYANRNVDARAAGRELRVDHVLNGTVSQKDHALSATIRLLRVQDGREIWSRRFTAPMEQLFSFPDEIYRSVSGEVGVSSTPLRAHYHPPAAAYEAYLKGMYDFSRRDGPGYVRAESAFRTALAIDPHYAAAWAALSDALGFQGKEESSIANERALELDDTLAEAHANVALASVVGRDLATARREFDRALALDPGNPLTHDWYAYYFVAGGNFPRALQEIETARRLDPSSLIIQSDVGNILFRARKYPEAIAQLEGVIRTDPTFAQAHGEIAQAYEMIGRYDDAIREIERAAELNGHDHGAAILARVYAAAGRTEEARRYLQNSALDEPAFVCMAYAALGEKQTALDWLERAYEKRSAEVALLNANPFFDPIRNEPRFVEIARRLPAAH